MASYQLREGQQSLVEQTINTWLEDDALVLLRLRRVARGGKAVTFIEGAEMERAEAIRLDGASILAGYVEAYGVAAGTYELLALFSTEGEKDRQAKRRFSLHRTPKGSAHPDSKGPEAATEALAGSLGGLVDGLANRQGQIVSSFMASLQESQSRSDEASERRLSEHATYQQEILRLHAELSRVHAELAIERILAEQSGGIPPEAWIKLMEEGVPLIGNLVGAATRALGAWSSGDAVQVEAPAADVAAEVAAPGGG